MRVALACPYSWDDPGGVQTHVRELAGRLAERGHDVLVVTPARGPVAEDRVEVVGRPVNLTYNASSAPIDPRPWSRSRVRHALSSFGPDVIHAHEPLAPSTGLWALLESGAPVVGTFHSGVARSLLYDLAAPALRRLSRRLVVRIAVSEAAAETARARIGGAFDIVPNGIDVARFASSQVKDLGEGTKLAFVGRLDERKGFRVVLEAFGILASDRADLRLVVVGDGPERRAVEGLPGPLRERVIMVGAVPNSDLPPYLAACHLFLGASIGGESFGIVLVEAMAAGLPVVASDVPGYDEVVRPGLDGLLVPPRDPGALAAAAARVLDDPELAASLAAAGRQRALSFDWTVVVERIEDIYRRAIAYGRPPIR